MLRRLWERILYYAKMALILAVIFGILWLVGSGVQSYLGLFGVKF